MWSCLRAIQVPNLSTRVQQYRSRRSILLFQIRVLFRSSLVPLLTWSRREHRQPGDALARPVFLQFLHVAIHIVLHGERTSRVRPLQHHVLSFEIRKLMRLAIAVGSGEIGGLVSWLRLSHCHNCENKNREQNRKSSLHTSSDYFFKGRSISYGSPFTTST